MGMTHVSDALHGRVPGLEVDHVVITDAGHNFLTVELQGEQHMLYFGMAFSNDVYHAAYEQGSYKALIGWKVFLKPDRVGVDYMRLTLAKELP